MPKKRTKQTFALYVRNFIFGVQDSLASTVGLLSGIAVAGVERNYILVAGIILIFVEAFSMGIGSLLSEHSAEEYLKRAQKINCPVIMAALIMFVSYFASGFIPLFPYLIWAPSIALGISIILSLITLFVLGIISANLFKVSVGHKVFEMLVIGGVAVIIGGLVGRWAEVFLR
jgi:VIT1/CCC1 family predicted Fe2+/Mn2+ transporter